MKFVLLGIVLAIGIFFAFQSHAVRAVLLDIKASGGALASRIVGNLSH